ncbi:MAG TPA: hypothetical protein DFH32_10040 [Lachnospiraceae bacterium]|nr:MAG: hypothetical protein BHW30_08570 [Firmicutes bacterium CAG_194_44_15]HCI18937.1 hypothetical protein [Lachnospiraceae bacterium]HCX41752.1 hypothetical protein [Lachnospiraceae bacterium]
MKKNYTGRFCVDKNYKMPYYAFEAARTRLLSAERSLFVYLRLLFAHSDIRWLLKKEEIL